MSDCVDKTIHFKNTLKLKNDASAFSKLTRLCMVKDHNESCTKTHHQDVRDRLEELHELGETIVAELALTTEVMVVGGDEFAEGHSTVRLVTEKVHHLLPKLLSALHFLHCTVCR